MDLRVRPLRESDVDAAREVQTRSFAALDAAQGEPPTEITEAIVERQRARVRHFLAHDPGGSWVAELGDEVAGVALALRRDSLWGLSLLVVDPRHQSRGVGRALLDASLGYADGAATAVILSSRDPRAIRSYGTAGFDLHPQVRATGRAGVLPPVSSRVRTGSAADLDLADAVDAAVRGAPRGPDQALLAGSTTMYVVDDARGRGYAYLRGDNRVVAVAATDDDTATDLLWACLAADPDHDITVDHINGAQQWAIRVALAARLRVQPAGCVFWRGRQPPAAYLPDGAYL